MALLLVCHLLYKLTASWPPVCSAERELGHMDCRQLTVVLSSLAALGYAPPVGWMQAVEQ